MMRICKARADTRYDTCWFFIHPTYVAGGLGNRGMTHEIYNTFAECVQAMNSLIRYWKETRWL